MQEQGGGEKRRNWKGNPFMVQKVESKCLQRAESVTADELKNEGEGNILTLCHSKQK